MQFLYRFSVVLVICFAVAVFVFCLDFCVVNIHYTDILFKLEKENVANANGSELSQCS